MQADQTVDLAISNHTGNWWFKINWWGSCTQVTGNSITGIGGYQVGTQHDVWAYSDSGCATQIATTTFTITPHNASLAATVNSDRSVDLTLSNGPSSWYFRIGYGSCTAVTGNAVTGIRGYKTGTYAVGAFSKSDCSGFLSDANFTIPPPTATLATTVNPGPSVNLTLTNGPNNNNWWFRINWWGTCTAVTGTDTVNNIRGYKAGTHSVKAYSDSSCNTEIASSSFTIPELVLSIAVDSSDRSVDLTLSGGPSNWWFKIGWWGSCTAATGTTVSNIRGYQSGSYLVAVYPAAGCAAGSHITAESFTMPSATLTTTVNSDRSVDLNLSNGPSNWWFRINSWGTCTAAPGTTVSGIQGYQDGTHPVSAYSDSGCKYHVASSSFTLTTATLTASAVTPTTATLTLTGRAGGWWLKETAPNTGTCTAGESDFSHALSSLTAGTQYTYKAYSDSACSSEIASETFPTSATLTTSGITSTTATLTIATHTSQWYYRADTGPDTTCKGPVSATTKDLTGLTAGTTYAYSAYSASGCANANLLATAASFTTLSLTASAVTPTSATLTLAGLSSGTNWWLQETSPSTGTCTAGESDFSHALSSLTAGTQYTYKAYSDSACSSEIASETFPTSATLTASGITSTTATLTIATHTSSWYYKADTGPDTTCKGPVSATTKDLTGLTAGTTYAYSAYSASGCANANLLATAASFTTPASLTATTVGTTSATLTLAGHTGTWYVKQTAPTSGTCTTKTSGTTHNTGTITAGTGYVYRAYSDSTCTTEIAAVAFSTPTTVSNLTASNAGNTNVGSYFSSILEVAQGFTAGSHTGGYTLTSIEISFSNTDGSPGNIVVTLHKPDTSNTANPSSTAQTTLTGTNPSSNATATFTCSTGCDLTAGDTYFVKVAAPNATGTARYTLWVTTSNSETTEPSANGWSIADDGRTNDAGWTNVDAIKIKVTALPKAGLAASSITTTSATLTLTGETGDWWLKETSPSTGTCTAGESDYSHALSSLTAGTSYTYKAYGDSACATTALQSVTFTTPLNDPTNLGAQYQDTSITSTANNELKVWWTRATGATGSVGYTVDCSSNNGTSYTSSCATVAATTDTSVSATVSTSGYNKVRVRATQSGANSGWVESAVPSGTAPGATSSPQLSVPPGGKYRYTWNKPSTPTGAVGYETQCVRVSQSTWESCGDNGTDGIIAPTTDATVSTDIPTGTYSKFRVRAVLNGLVSAWANHP